MYSQCHITNLRHKSNTQSSSSIRIRASLPSVFDTILGIQERTGYRPCLQFSSVIQSCLTLSDPMNRSMPGLPVHHQVHSNSHPSSRWCHPALSSSVIPFSSCPQSFPASESFPVSQLFAWGGQSTGVSVSNPINALYLVGENLIWNPFWILKK